MAVIGTAISLHGLVEKVSSELQIGHHDRGRRSKNNVSRGG